MSLVLARIVLSLSAKINGVSYTGDSLESIITTNNLVSEEIRSIEISDGNAPSSYAQYANLEDLVIDKNSFQSALPSNMFKDNKIIRKVHVPGATSVGISCFQGCSAFKDVILTAATTFGNNAFRDSGIETINLPSATVLSHRMFSECPLLKTATLPSVGTFVNVKEGGYTVNRGF